MRLQSSHTQADRGSDAYFTPREAIISLIHLERGNIPSTIWEPACGDGAIAIPLHEAGFRVITSDIQDYGLPGTDRIDYLQALAQPWPVGIITNPPFRLALEFARKAIRESGFVALLLRTNFLESTGRMQFFQAHPPSRVWISSRRLPMMHRYGWTGPRATSNTAHAWFIWNGPVYGEQLRWFDWKENQNNQ